MQGVQQYELAKTIVVYAIVSNIKTGDSFHIFC
jgi:hypothetical protein